MNNKEEIKKLAVRCLEKWENKDSCIEEHCAFCKNTYTDDNCTFTFYCDRCLCPSYICYEGGDYDNNNNLVHLILRFDNIGSNISDIMDTKEYKYIILALKELEKNGEISKTLERKIKTYIGIKKHEKERENR